MGHHRLMAAAPAPAPRIRSDRQVVRTALIVVVIAILCAPIIYHVRGQNAVGESYSQLGVTSLWLPRTITVTTGPDGASASCQATAWLLLFVTWDHAREIDGANESVTCTTWPLAS